MTRLILFLLLPIVCFSQNQYNQWHFGYQAKLDFNSGSPVASTQSAMSSLEGSASVADCDGNLLFYTDGETVWAKNHNMMDNGYDLKGESSLYSSTQSSLIIKRPKSSAIYYIFTASDIYGINYSVINMAANGGLGRVIQKNVVLDGKPSQKLAVTYHQNGEDIWLVTHYEDNDEYEAFKVTKTGVSSNSVISQIGPKHTSGHGDMKFNQQGSKLAAVVQDQNLVSLADFNNGTGVVTNSFGSIDRYGYPHGVDFSPNGSKMYVSAWGSPGGVFQCDVNLGNANAISTGVSISGGHKPEGSLQLGPDGKIYVADDGSNYLGVVTFPNNAGLGAFFQKNGLYLGGRRSSWELTNVTLNSNVIVAPNGISSSGFCVNSPTAFSVLSEDGVISVLWDFDDVASGIDNNSTQYYPNHQFSSPGTYDVKLTILTECGTEDYMETITIQSGPLHPMDSVELCQQLDQTIGFTSVAGESYSWSPAVGLSNVNVSNPVFNSTGITVNEMTYYVTSTSSSGCENVDSIHVSLLELPKAGLDQFQCPGFNVQLNLDGSIIAALWSPSADVNDPNSLNPITSSTFSQFYYVQLTDSNGCVNTDSVWVEVGDSIPVNAGPDVNICEGDSIEIGSGISLSNASYLWVPATRIEDPSSLVTNVYPDVNQTYIITVSIDTCSRSDSVFVNVNSLPEIQISPADTSVCLKDSISLTGGNGLNYTWYENLLEIGNQDILEYEVKGSTEIILLGIDSNNCSNQDTIVLTHLELPNIDLTKDSAICIGDSLELEVTGGVQFEWLNHELIGSSDSIVKVGPSDSKTYLVGVTGANSCYSEDSVLVTVHQLPIIQMFDDTLICEGSFAKLWASGGVKYNWSPSTNLTSFSFQDSVIYPADSITYQVVVTDVNGCIDSASSKIDININPEANYSYEILATCLGYEVQFTDSSLNADSHSWIFGDGGTSTDLNPFHIYNYSSEVNTSLIVGNNSVCFDTLTTAFKWNKIGDFIDVFVPNIITPNSDGLNDCFEVKVPQEFEDCVEFEIFNRWGLKVYDTKDFHTKFCGFNAYNNQELSEGTYFYKLDINDFVVNGFVTIAR